MTVMGGKDVAKAIRRKHKGKTPNEPVFQPEKLPSGSIIAMDLSIFLINFVKSDEGSAQVTSSPLQSCTSVQDRLDFFYVHQRMRTTRMEVVACGGRVIPVQR